MNPKNGDIYTFNVFIEAHNTQKNYHSGPFGCEIARIKVENIMNDDLYIQLLEVLELYCEILEARFGLLDSRCGTMRSVQSSTYLTIH